MHSFRPEPDHGGPAQVAPRGVGAVTAEIQLRPGVVFRADASGVGSIEFPKGRRFETVTFCGALPGTTDIGARAHVNVLSAVSQTSKDKQNDFEHLPVLVV